MKIPINHIAFKKCRLTYLYIFPIISNRCGSPSNNIYSYYNEKSNKNICNKKLNALPISRNVKDTVFYNIGIYNLPFESVQCRLAQAR
jgi:hypothetical protein